jgi:hypothetical protein
MREETVAEWGKRVAPGIAKAIDEKIASGEADPEVAAKCHEMTPEERAAYEAKHRDWLEANLCPNPNESR